MEIFFGTIAVYQVFYLLLAHYVSDFIMQTDYMARGKSKTFKPLALHIGVYTLTLLVMTYFLFNSFFIALGFAVTNGLIHMLVDYFTSRESSKLFSAGKAGSETIPNFGGFSVIGFDQFVHTFILIMSFVIFAGL